MNIRKKILGGIPGLYDEFDETDFERETSGNGIFEAIVSLGQDISGVEPKQESNGSEKFPSKGTIEFNAIQTQAEQFQKQKKEADRKKAFYQALKEDQERAQREKDRLLFEEEINDIDYCTIRPVIETEAFISELNSGKN